MPNREEAGDVDARPAAAGASPRRGTLRGDPGAQRTHAIRFEDVVMRYGKFPALDGLSFDVRRGEIYGLLGPNGSGKTTAIKVLVGLERIAGGTLTALGAKAPSRALLARIGYMPQETSLYVDLTIRENLRFFASLYGVSTPDFDKRVPELLSLVGLEKWENEPISNLSGGMKHRASLVASLLHEPELLVLDEPTVGVDPELRAGFWQYFRDLKAKGKTLLLTTHYMDEARNCDRIGFLRSGKLLAEGTVPEILARAGVDDLEQAFLRLASRGTASRSTESRGAESRGNGPEASA
ncbi:MAG: ABC transporter ATP-binding protein [Thermoplasmatota archaeon]